jgi:hypothetical protein
MLVAAVLFAGRAEARPALRQDLMPGVERAPPSLELLLPSQAAGPKAGMEPEGSKPVEEPPAMNGVQRFSKGHPPLRHVAADAEPPWPHAPSAARVSIPPSVPAPVHGLWAQLGMDAVKKNSALLPPIRARLRTPKCRRRSS